MKQINVYAKPEFEGAYGYTETERIGHFDGDKAERWSDWRQNGSENGGPGRGRAVLLTASGQWILEAWTQHAGEKDYCYYIEPGEAREWLLKNNFDEAVSKHLGEIPAEEDNRGGRPAIGNPVLVRLGELLGPVDEYATRTAMSRAEALRNLINLGLDAHDPQSADQRR